MRFGKVRPEAGTAYGAKMKTFVRLVLVGAILLTRCAWAAESAPVAFAKSVVSERGSQAFATVSYPDESLIVEFQLEPYSAGKANAVRAFGEITKKRTRRFQQIFEDQERPGHWHLVLRDKHGNDTVDRAVVVKFSKAKTTTISWENIDSASIVEGLPDHYGPRPRSATQNDCLELILS